MNDTLLHETLNIYISADSYVFEPSLGSQPGLMISDKAERETLTIDRRTGKMTLNARNTSAPLGREKVITCYGIIGIVSLATTDFLLVITSRTPSCRLLSHAIFLANDFRLLPLSPLSTSTAILDHPIEKELVTLVEQGLKGGKLWFSYGWDLTNSLQRQYEQARQDADAGASAGGSGGVGRGKAMWQRADDRFFWNKYLMSRMIEQTEMGGPENDLSRFILPVMHGSIELRSATINNQDLLFSLISRRSRYRAGTRYFTRGIDSSGHTANFNETEQIVLLDPLDETSRTYGSTGRVEGRERLSFVQTRGSVPIFWAEVNNLRYKPDLQIMDLPDSVNALRKHISEQISIYGEVWLVNLVNQKGHEKPVKEAFEKAISALSEPKVQYVYFDFHHECRKLRYDRIQVLVDLLTPDLEKMGYFHIDTTPAINSTPHIASMSSIPLPNLVPQRTQKGVIRSNCMDCLDRTNVTQAAIAKDALQRQLRAAGVLSHKETLDEHADFMHIFRNVWADHADTISKSYSGSGALKTDFTRTGKRTKEGALQDGINSVTRYVKNNFFDGPRQDAMDLLTGQWKAARGGMPHLTDTRPLLMRSMPYIFAFSSLMIIAALVLPQPADFSARKWVFWWTMIAMMAFVYIWGHGTSYVAWPRLNPPWAILSYEGAGFRSTPHGRGSNILPGFLSASRAAAGATAELGRKMKVTKMEEVELGRKKGSLID